MVCFRHIVSNICTICIGLVLVSFVCAASVHAQNISAGLNVTVSIQSNGSARVKYSLSVNNSNSDNYVNLYKLDVPFEGVSSTKATIDGRTVDSVLTKKLEGKTQLSIQFPSRVIEPGATKNLTVEFTVNPAIRQSGDHRTFSFPVLQTDYDVTRSDVRILVPQFPEQELLYVSVEDQSDDPGVVESNGENAIFLMWGPRERTVGVSKQLSNTTGEVAAFSLPSEFSTQRTEYLKLLGADKVGKSSKGNYWAFVSPNQRLVWQANVTLGDLRFSSSLLNTERCVDASPTQELANNQLDSLLTQARNFYYQRFEVEPPGSNSVFDYAQLQAKLAAGHGQLSQLELACTLKSLLADRQIPSQIMYGYYVNDVFAGINSTTPHAWIAYLWNENQIRLFDPNFNIATGLENNDLPGSILLPMGIFTKETPFDSALGMVSGSPITKPDISKVYVLGAESRSADLEVVTDFPDQVFSGEFYAGMFGLQNNTNWLVDINTVSLDGSDYGASIRLWDGINAVLQPGWNQFNISFAREPNFLRSGAIRHELVLGTSHSRIPEVKGFFTVKYSPDSRLLVAAMGFVGLIGFLIVSHALRWVYLDVNAKRKAYAQVYKQHTKAPASNQNAPEKIQTVEAKTRAPFSIKDIFKD